MRRFFTFAAFASLGFASVSVYAQNEPPIGSRLGSRRDIAIPLNAREAAQASHKLANCIYLKQPKQVRAALDSLDAKDTNRVLAALGTKNNCLNLYMVADGTHTQRAVMPTDIYRGMLAEAVLRKDNLAASLTPSERKASYTASWFSVTGRPLAVDEMGACLAETNPAGVRALVATTVQSSEEARSFSELSAWMGPCLTVGAQLNANRQSLRAALAEALYHRAVTITAPVVAPE